MTVTKKYTTQLQAGLGVIEETRALLNIWEPGVNRPELYKIALESGYFPNISARRLLNLIKECFAPRYLVEQDHPAAFLKKAKEVIPSPVFNQLLLLFTARANSILHDFIRQVYWVRYSSGYERISNEDAKDFVIRANQEGKTTKPWSESTIRRVASYLTGCCADFGLLESGAKSVRRIIPFRVSPISIVLLAYDLHFSGLGDNAVIAHQDWELFGLQKEDVLEEIKRLSLKGYFIVQTAGDVVRISWNYKTWEKLSDVITQS